MHSVKDIYLIRHGETAFNRLGMVQGSGIDSDLNELGQQQAASFFEHYKHLPIDKIYTSKLKRTHQSVQGFIDKGISWEQHEGLNEISWGNKEGKESTEEDQTYYKNLVKTWRAGHTHIPSEEGESPLQVLERQKPVIDIMLSRPEERNILIAMHGRAMRVLLTYLFDKPLHHMDEYRHTNLCLYHIQYNYPEGKFKLMDACNTKHLHHLKDTFTPF